MLHKYKTLQKFIICTLVVVLAQNTSKAQLGQPTWWFGVSGAANLNFSDGTTQRLNNSLIVPTAFHKGFGVRPFASVLMEYRPVGAWGGILNVGYDGRGGKFDDVIAPCNCPATLETNTSYISVEPSLRYRAGQSNLYFFAGPRLAFNMQKDFKYTQLKQPNTDGELSNMRNTLVSGQVGMGYDFPISAPSKTNKVVLSPFVSYHPYFGQEPRSIESWSITTVRAGLALKFGKGAKVIPTPPVSAVIPVADVNFAVREPKSVSEKRMVSETLPLRNSVFFDEGSNEIPNRYTQLNQNEAIAFKEDQLQNQQTPNMVGRSTRQLGVYHNILNIIGDRLRANPNTSLTLVGSSGNGPAEGKQMAEGIKQYWVSTFGINGSRLNVEGRTKPVIPSEQPGATKELELLREGDRRVDMVSSSPELFLAVGGGSMKPVQINSTQVDPLDSHVIFNVGGAKDAFKSWKVKITDENGAVQNFGPYTSDMESVPGSTILGNRPMGDYKVSLIGETKTGGTITKESKLRLTKENTIIDKAYRYIILFDFNQSKAITAYEKFLTEVVSPSIADGSTVIVHGHTDIIGDEEYNRTLSNERAMEVEKIIKNALAEAGKNNVKFETFGFGEDVGQSPFNNGTPEERFYNRTVIIDIVPAK